MKSFKVCLSNHEAAPECNPNKTHHFHSFQANFYYESETFQDTEVFIAKKDYERSHLEQLFSAVKTYKHFSHVQEHILKVLLYIVTYFLNFMNKCQVVVQYSSMLIHFKNTLLSCKWILENLLQERRLTLQATNMLVSKMVDIVLGCVAIYYFITYQDELMKAIMITAEDIIDNLKVVLNTLMDSPAGLKLNYAFSRTLGVFFFYHISLWRAFIRAIYTILPDIFRFFYVSGFVGLSFQVAIITDLIAFLTFHVYCIYVYAARLYGLQIYSLTTLWKLFIGRKYNPLRNRIDSFQYSHNQLFVGTLGFTVLLFLLPTTFLYYAVFTIFRLSLLFISKLLNTFKSALQCLPLYVIILWLLGRPGVKGNLCLMLDKTRLHNSINFIATLKPLPLWTTILAVMPSNAQFDMSMSWGDLFRGVFSGTLI